MSSQTAFTLRKLGGGFGTYSYVTMMYTEVGFGVSFMNSAFRRSFASEVRLYPASCVLIYGQLSTRGTVMGVEGTHAHRDLQVFSRSRLQRLDLV